MTKSRTRSVGLLAPAILAITAFTVGAAPAPTSDSPEETEIPRTSPDTKVFIVDSRTAVELQDAVFYPTGDLDRDTLIVMPELYRAAGLTYADVARVATYGEMEGALAAGNSRMSCGGSTTGVYGSWSAPVESNCHVAGHNGYTEYYSWAVPFGTNQDGCGQGKGYYQGYNGSTFGVWMTYYGLGCGTSGGATVPWGNVWAYPAVKAQSTIVVHVATLNWLH